MRAIDEITHSTENNTVKGFIEKITQLSANFSDPYTNKGIIGKARDAEIQVRKNIAIIISEYLNAAITQAQEKKPWMRKTYN